MSAEAKPRRSDREGAYSNASSILIVYDSRYLGRLPSLGGVKVATFDTRLTSRLVRVFGFAADKIAVAVENRDGVLAAAPEGFFVAGKKGPLVAGELERASAWARGLLEELDR